MTVFKMRYGRRYRTAPYETAEILIEEDYDTTKMTFTQAHVYLRNVVDIMVNLDKDHYQQETVNYPERKGTHEDKGR
jgi:protein-tyrosine-phosphatase